MMREWPSRCPSGLGKSLGHRGCTTQHISPLGSVRIQYTPCFLLSVSGNIISRIIFIDALHREQGVMDICISVKINIKPLLEKSLSHWRCKTLLSAVYSPNQPSPAGSPTKLFSASTSLFQPQPFQAMPAPSAPASPL